MGENYIKRALEDKFLRMSSFFKVVLLTGARQVGKTTMLKKLAEKQKLTYVSLDNMDARYLAMNDPVLFFQRFRPPIVIDEIQYAPQLFSQIKVLCDESKLAGQFWLTGSQKFSMMKSVTESLAGRVGIMELHGFSRSEICGVSDSPLISFDLESLIKREDCVKLAKLDDVFLSIIKGGMPKVQNASSEERELYFDSYINTYLIKDVMELYGIVEIIKFRKFLTALAAFTAQPVNIARLSSIAEISQPTAKNWIRLLEGMNIIHFLEPYYNNRIKRLTKTPKLYFWDCGLCAYLTRWTSPEVLAAGAANGAFFETFVVNELLKSFSCSSLNVEVSYYRDSNDKEIDLFIQDGHIISPIEIKLSASPSKNEVKKFEIIERLGLQRGNGGIICLCESVLPISNNTSLIPVGLI